MARGVRLPRTAGRPPRFLRTGHRRATSLSEAHLQAAQRDAGHTLGREAEGILQSLLFHRASRGLLAQRRHSLVLAEGDPNGDAALASAVSCPPPPRSLTPPRPPLSDQRARAARLRRCPDCPRAVARDGSVDVAGMTASDPQGQCIAGLRVHSATPFPTQAVVAGADGGLAWRPTGVRSPRFPAPDDVRFRTSACPSYGGRLAPVGSVRTSNYVADPRDDRRFARMLRVR